MKSIYYNNKFSSVKCKCFAMKIILSFFLSIPLINLNLSTYHSFRIEIVSHQGNSPRYAYDIS